MTEPINYEELTAAEVVLIIEGLRAVESEGLRKTQAEQSYIMRHITSSQLVEVARLMQSRNSLAPLFGKTGR